MERTNSGLLFAAILISGFISSGYAASAQSMCGWYAVGGCFKQRSQAEDRAEDLADAYVIRTNDIKGFARGWWCAADGPYDNQSAANSAKRKFARKGVSDAYVKKGGCR